jgi:predicted hydrocarbon binding protein
MAEVKGKFITLACSLLETKPEAKTAALEEIKTRTGLEWNELDPEGWYDTEVFEAVFNSIEKNTSRVMAWAAIKVIGQSVYPTIQRTAGLPQGLDTPSDFVKFEAQGFLENHRGPDVIPRKVLEDSPNRVVMEAPSPGYNCALIEGVFEGILHMCDRKEGRVKQTKCVKNGDPTCEYTIEW